jgi:hypothetical protein
MVVVEVLQLAAHFVHPDLKVFAEAYIHREFESHSVRPSFVIIDSEQEIIIVGLTRVGGASLLFPRQFTPRPI